MTCLYVLIFAGLCFVFFTSPFEYGIRRLSFILHLTAEILQVHSFDYSFSTFSLLCSCLPPLRCSYFPEVNFFCYFSPLVFLFCFSSLVEDLWPRRSAHQLRLLVDVGERMIEALFPKQIFSDDQLAAIASSPKCRFAAADCGPLLIAGRKQHTRKLTDELPGPGA